MVLHEILAQARAVGVERLRGVYRPTERNAMVREHYAKLGFALLRADADGATHWELETRAEVAVPPMTVRRPGRVTEHA
jgi:predicted enzyme involved in methoxymalonyl-ACP biosynthesis